MELMSLLKLIGVFFFKKFSVLINYFVKKNTSCEEINEIMNSYKKNNIYRQKSEILSYNFLQVKIYKQKNL